MAPDDCCPMKTVRDASGEDSKLNGVYILKTKEDTKPDPVCVDGCIYVKENREYCFKEEAGATPTVVCEVEINIFSSLSTFYIMVFNSNA